MQLGVLDIQHPQRALQLAPEVERLGYSRYWLGEHHGSAEQSGSPEIMTGLIAAITKRIRVGPAGVLLRYYTPYKVAQNHRLLEDIFSPRIDLGVARGIGGNAAVAELLLDGRVASTDVYEAKVRELAAMLQGSLPEGHRGHEAPCFGRTSPPSDFWVLGTTKAAALLAASVGASFAFSDYLARMTDPNVDGPAVIRAYRDAFEPRRGRSAPQWNVAIAGVAVPHEGDRPETWSLAGPPPLIGTAQQWRTCLRSYAERYESDELIIFDICEHLADRRMSYALFAEAAELTAES
jgi:luciferase family oxidoreductase group 1